MGNYNGGRDDSIPALQRRVENNIADLERTRGELPPGSDREMNQAQCDQHIASARRELAGLDQLARGNTVWPDERGPRT